MDVSVRPSNLLFRSRHILGETKSHRNQAVLKTCWKSPSGGRFAVAFSGKKKFENPFTYKKVMTVLVFPTVPDQEKLSLRSAQHGCLWYFVLILLCRSSFRSSADADIITAAGQQDVGYVVSAKDTLCSSAAKPGFSVNWDKEFQLQKVPHKCPDQSYLYMYIGW